MTAGLLELREDPGPSNLILAKPPELGTGFFSPYPRVMFGFFFPELRSQDQRLEEGAAFNQLCIQGLKWGGGQKASSGHRTRAGY